MANFSFTSEIYADRTDKGFFISGQLGVPISGQVDDILLGDSFFGDGMATLLMEDDSPFSISTSGVRRPIF
jgi:hypothetical protein